MKILNLGAGNRIIEGADNHDIVKHREEINLIWDLNTIHWFDNSFESDLHFHDMSIENWYDEIQFISVIEHLKITPIEALNECHRLLKPTGKLILKYPHADSTTMNTDPTHRWRMNEHSMNYLDPGTQQGKDYDYYSPYKWCILTPTENRCIIKGGGRINVKMVMEPIK